MPADVPLLLVDGHNLLWRAAFGFPAAILSRDKTRDLTGEFGFFALLRVAIREDRPTPPGAAGSARTCPSRGRDRFTSPEHGIAGVTTPPATVRPLCRHAQPRTVGDELPGTVDVTCAFRWGLRLGWRRRATAHTVPADTALIACPVCGTLATGPATG